MNKALLCAAAAMAATFATPAAADVVVLDFEGISDLSPVGSFYAPDYSFSADTLAVIDADSGGSGNFANEPSPNTIMFFLNANNAVLDVTNGFDTGFSFFYSSSTAATVNVYGGLGGTGDLLASLDLTAQGFSNCVGDPSGSFCNWTAVGVEFIGTAFSIDFGGTANQTGFDDITFGSATPGGGAVPEPGTWAMMLLGFGAVGFAMRRRKGASLNLANA